MILALIFGQSSIQFLVVFELRIYHFLFTAYQYSIKSGYEAPSQNITFLKNALFCHYN